MSSKLLRFHVGVFDFSFVATNAVNGVSRNGGIERIGLIELPFHEKEELYVIPAGFSCPHSCDTTMCKMTGGVRGV